MSGGASDYAKVARPSGGRKGMGKPLQGNSVLVQRYFFSSVGPENRSNGSVVATGTQPVP